MVGVADPARAETLAETLSAAGEVVHVIGTVTDTPGLRYTGSL
jgi:phosphoribosylformylglycinamidine cyclo-ligase